MDEKGYETPARSAYSREEMANKVREFMRDMYGRPSESDNKDAWFERYGLLISFVTEYFPAQY